MLQMVDMYVCSQDATMWDTLPQGLQQVWGTATPHGDKPGVNASGLSPTTAWKVLEPHLWVAWSDEEWSA